MFSICSYYRSTAVGFKWGTVDLVSIRNVTTRVDSSLRKGKGKKEEERERKEGEPHRPWQRLTTWRR